MNRSKIKNTLGYILIIGIGAIASWHLSFFRPFSAIYPKPVAYKITNYKQSLPDSVIARPGAQYQASNFGEFWLGKHYRFLWAAPVKAKVLNLKRAGLKIEKKGGGMQTTSFTLKDSNGQEFSLRSVDKDPVSVVPPFLWPTSIAAFIRDQVSATDPFALIPVLKLTERAGISNGTATLVFVMDNDPDFRAFNYQKSGFFYLSPKYAKPDKVNQTDITQGSATHNEPLLESTEMLANLQQNPGNSIDTTLFLKCRLFDLLIGDWDRHQGQWDWVGFPAENHTVFQPLPKDRDQAFGYYADGICPYLLTRDFVVGKITSFTPHYQDIAGFSQNGSNLDNLFLKTISEKELQAVVADLQTRLSDSALKEAIVGYPKSVLPLVAKDRFETLKARRNQLPEAAAEFIRIVKDRP